MVAGSGWNERNVHIKNLMVREAAKKRGGLKNGPLRKKNFFYHFVPNPK